MGKCYFQGFLMKSPHLIASTSSVNGDGAHLLSKERWSIILRR